MNLTLFTSVIWYAHAKMPKFLIYIYIYNLYIIYIYIYIVEIESLHTLIEPLWHKFQAHAKPK